MNTQVITTPDHDQLYTLAEGQAGYFSAAQAKEAGFGHALLSYHAQTGLLERVWSGVYRLKRFPASPHEDLFIAWLRVGPRSVISHDSALTLYDLSDLLPHEIHLTVPRTLSRRHRGLRLHTNRLEPDEVTHYRGLPVTTVARTIADAASSGLSEELVRQAIDEAIDRGMVAADELLAAGTLRGGRAKRLIGAFLVRGGKLR